MNEMSYLEKLLDGVDVEWLPLGDVVRIKNGKDHKLLGEGEFPVYGSGGIMRYVDTYVYNKPSVLIPRKGSLGNLFFVDTPFWNVDTIFYTEIDEAQIKPKYLYYFLTTVGLGEMNQAGGVPSQTQSVLNKLKIPIPCPNDPEKSLAIQSEIVRILDKFTALTAELTAELTARKKQYNYYRDQLLSFGEGARPPYLEKLLDGVEVEWSPISKVFDLKNGYTPSKSNKEYWENGDIPWFRMDDIRENGHILSESLQKISYTAVKSGKLFPANSILISTSATIGEHALITVPHLANQRFTCLTLKPDFIDNFDIKFIFYYCFSLADWCRKNTTTSSFSSVDMDGFRKCLIPIPCPNDPEKSLAIQSEIVRILDKFDTLTHSISEGLPREIELRQKQYEYYRDLLFSFPKPDSTTVTG